MKVSHALLFHLSSKTDEETRNNSRATREIDSLRKHVEEIQQESDKCRGYLDDLQICKVHI